MRIIGDKGARYIFDNRTDVAAFSFYAGQAAVKAMLNAQSYL
jgi:hypothetical protein